MFNVSIPLISDEELAKRYAQIKPVIKFKGGLHFFREFAFEELRTKSYLWNACENVREEVENDTLEVMDGRDFLCLHTYGYPGFFKPSIAEVLSQIEEHLIPQVKAFEIITYPEQIYDFDPDALSSIAFRRGYHVSRVRLYRAKH